MKILAIQTNSEGRPCGWGTANISGDPDAKAKAKAEALRQWDEHSCYLGERKGDLIFHFLEDEAEKA